MNQTSESSNNHAYYLAIDSIVRWYFFLITQFPSNCAQTDLSIRWFRLNFSWNWLERRSNPNDTISTLVAGRSEHAVVVLLTQQLSSWVILYESLILQIDATHITLEAVWVPVLANCSHKWAPAENQIETTSRRFSNSYKFKKISRIQ